MRLPPGSLVLADPPRPARRVAPARCRRKRQPGPLAAPPAAVPPLPAHGARLPLLDAVRGVACLAVVCHHANNVLEMAADRPVLPRAVRATCELGAAGVQVFFVLSGFVIALSLRSFRPTPGSVARFALRRQIRLDPTYWAALALAATLSLLAHTPSPSPAKLAAHAAYLQRMLGYRDLLGVSWTLCLEVQFYIVFVALLAAAATLARHRPHLRDRTATALVAGLAVASTFAPRSMVLAGTWFGPYWFYFAGGVLCYWAWIGRTPVWAFVAVVAAFAIGAPASLKSVLVGVPMCLGLYAAARTGRLAACTGGPVLQYLGRISYSLYVVHLTVITAVLFGHARPPATTPAAALAWAAVVGVLSVGVAHVLHVTVERPTARLAARLPR